MSDDVSVLRALLPAYAGHDSVAARRLSDQQVRAFAGETLVGVQDRVPLGDLQTRFDALVIRCEFGDQHVILALENGDFAAPEAVALVEGCDRVLVEAAARGGTVDAGGLETFIGDVERALDARVAAVTAWLKR